MVHGFFCDFVCEFSHLAAAVVIAGCQLAQLVLVGLISFQLVRQINDKLVSANFLIQSYLSTTVVFAGIYFIVYALSGNTSFHIYVDAGSKFRHVGQR